MASLIWFLVGFFAAVPGAFLILLAARRRAGRASRRARDAEHLASLGEMTGGLAHEIKNPLSTVSLNAQLLGEEVQDLNIDESGKHRVLARINSLAREVDRLGNILEDFLRFAGRLRPDFQNTDISFLLVEIGDFFMPQARQHGVSFSVERIEKKLFIEIDAALLKQAILNILLNGVQAMDAVKGKRELKLSLQSNANCIEIVISDTGEGISKDRIDAIFHPYVSGKPGGTGLGLATTRRIVELQGGEVEVRSEVGIGSKFILRFPKGVNQESQIL